MSEQLASIPQQLASEFRRLGTGPVATFSTPAMEAYTLVALLQLAMRHPHLSETQHDLASQLTHDLADQLTNMARAILGADSAIETTIAMGFEPQYDVSCEEDEDDAIQEAPDPDDLEDLAFADEAEEDSHVLGERRCRYVEPKWIALREDEEEVELSKCAKCARFFVQHMPIRLFQELSGDVVLGYEVCESCAPSVVQQMR